mmetsp:Transcript_11579/g.18222  ORF Transcript_11579/g.18222 Transcript_11579/m.18222 type:complete len:375 (+) Transcript_11579:173-1297(+)
MPSPHAPIRVLIRQKNGSHIQSIQMMQIEFDENDVPTSLSCYNEECATPYDEQDLYKPFSVKLYNSPRNRTFLSPSVSDPVFNYIPHQKLLPKEYSALNCNSDGNNYAVGTYTRPAVPDSYAVGNNYSGTNTYSARRSNSSSGSLYSERILMDLREYYRKFPGGCPAQKFRSPVEKDSSPSRKTSPGQTIPDGLSPTQKISSPTQKIPGRPCGQKESALIYFDQRSSTPLYDESPPSDNSPPQKVHVAHESFQKSPDKNSKASAHTHSKSSVHIRSSHINLNGSHHNVSHYASPSNISETESDIFSIQNSRVICPEAITETKTKPSKYKFVPNSNDETNLFSGDDFERNACSTNLFNFDPHDPGDVTLLQFPSL